MLNANVPGVREHQDNRSWRTYFHLCVFSDLGHIKALARAINCVWQLIMHILVKQCRIDGRMGRQMGLWPIYVSFGCYVLCPVMSNATPSVTLIFSTLSTLTRMTFDTRIYKINNGISSWATRVPGQFHGKQGNLKLDFDFCLWPEHFNGNWHPRVSQRL